MVQPGSPQTSPGPGYRADDEVLSGGGLPRWVWLVVLVLAAALIARLLVQVVSGSSGTPGALPTSPHTTAPPAKATPLDVLRTDEGTWVVSRKSLSLVNGSRVIRKVSLAGLRLPMEGTLQLTIDPTVRRLWVITTQSAPTRLLGFDLAHLALVRDVRWGELVSAATAYRGHLYVSSDLGIADLAPRATEPAFIPGLRGAVGPLTLDPRRHRLLAADLGSPTEVWAYRPGSRPTVAPQFLPLTNGTLAVVNDAIWIAGFGAHGALLGRLDPRTLRPLGWRDISDQFGTGAVVAGSGMHVIWIRSSLDTGLVACLDAGTGRVQQRWTISAVNAVASDRRGALAATSDGLLGLVLAGCRG